METNNKTEEEQWNKEVNRERAVALFQSFRGKYIIGQALFVAIEAMEAVEPDYMREVSNISDMRFLMEILFPMYSMVAVAAKGSKEDFWEMIDKAKKEEA